MEMALITGNHSPVAAQVPVAAIEEPIEFRGPNIREPQPALPKVDEYWEKPLREHRNFIRACTINHRIAASYFSDDTYKIDVAFTFFRGNVADAWEREEKRRTGYTHTWGEFSDFLGNQI